MMDFGKLEQIEISVQGMTGIGGEPKVLQALEGLPGVKKAVVCYPEKEAIVTYTPETINFDRMKKALIQIGYVASIPENDPQCQSNVNFELSGTIEFQNDDMVCYCFGYTRDDIEQDYLKNDQSTIMAKIATEKKAGECECATKNPKGRGCLGDVRQVVDKLKGKSTPFVIS